MDYCNCLLMGAPESVIKQLERFQNYAVSLVFVAPRHHHSTPSCKTCNGFSLQSPWYWLTGHKTPSYLLLIWESMKHKVESIILCSPCYKWFQSFLPLWTGACPHSVLYTSLHFWFSHIQALTIQTQDAWFTHFSYFGPNIWNSLSFHLRHYSALSSFQTKWFFCLKTNKLCCYPSYDEYPVAFCLCFCLCLCQSVCLSVCLSLSLSFWWGLYAWVFLLSVSPPHPPLPRV